MRRSAAMIVIGSVFIVGCSQTSTPSSPSASSAAAAGENSVALASVGPTARAAGEHPVGFGLNGTVSGFPTGVVFLSGGGAFELGTHGVHAGGGFSCVQPVLQGPLSTSINSDDPGPCLKDQGVRWDTAALLDSTSFKCTAAATPEPAITSDHLVVLQADFYRAGNGNDESFTAIMIASDHDISTHFPGVNLWVQGVGCGTAHVNFAE
jgi:hypothetical protein